MNPPSQGDGEDIAEPVRVFVGLGSNLDDPAGQLQRAIYELAEIPATHLIGYSGFYRSVPMGPPDQPEYMNAVAALEARLPPLALLDELQQIENAHGRKRTLHWGARTLDLDLLLYGAQIIDTPRLQVPHPGITERNFVLYPLQELEPDLEIPGKGTLQELIKSCSPEGLKKYDPD
jgi:2-amino-4-hydroxy-6-hydroxymethyldihydropteridine diphosphokinase